MRIVLDTNVVLSALLWRGTPHHLLATIGQRSSIQLYSSTALLEELADRVPEERRQLAQGQGGVTRQGRQGGRGFRRRHPGRPGGPGHQRLPPLPRMAEKLCRAAFDKVGRTEGLQRVLHRQRPQQGLSRLGGGTCITGQAPPGCKVVAQLRHQHRGRALVVVVQAAPRPADVQVLARRQQRLQEEVAVVLAARSVTRARVLRHQVEVGRDAAARVVAVVHAQQRHEAEGNRAHRHQRGEGAPRAMAAD